jgi:hypothetical protein
LKEGYPLSINVPLTGKRQMMKVVVYDEIADRVGSQKVYYAAKR